MNYAKKDFLCLLLIRVNVTSLAGIFQFRDWSMGSMTRDRFATSVFAGWMSIFGFSCSSHFNAGQDLLVHIKLDGLLS